MRAVDIEALRDRLGEYLQLAAAGESLLVVDRDGVVAQLGPPPPQPPSSVSNAGLAQAIREGLITPAALPARSAPPPTAGVMTLEELPDDLDRARADR